MKEDINLYDTSDYDENNIYNLPLVNKKVIGKMKDENKGNIMTEYVGLKSKMRKQLNSAAGTKQLNSAAGTKQLNSSVGMKQLNSSVGTALPSTQPPTPPATVSRLQPPATAYNRLQPPTTAYDRLRPPATACNRLQPPATACTACTAFTAESAFLPTVQDGKTKRRAGSHGSLSLAAEKTGMLPA
ncbi:hypothetical protein TNCV_3492001 [Trichonephila clavipes]|nr:hypothetical protein TNCV_3492001 [Trichonephila clavipes]